MFLTDRSHLVLHGDDAQKDLTALRMQSSHSVIPVPSKSTDNSIALSSTSARRQVNIAPSSERTMPQSPTTTTAAATTHSTTARGCNLRYEGSGAGGGRRGQAGKVIEICV